MKLQSLTTVFTVGAIAFGATVSLHQPSYAQARGFYCDRSTGVPVTVYQTYSGAREPWIRWTSNYFTQSGYDPVQRCEEVSARLETYRLSKKLRFITVGIMNGQRVVCTASRFNGRCEGLIFTLKPREDGVRTLNNLLAWRDGQAGAPSLYESGTVPYIDVSDRLGQDTNPTPSSTPSNVEPVPSQPQPDGGRSGEFN